MALTNRVFRLTKVGMQDLQGICACHGLVPYIKTLTFGSADVAQAKNVHMQNILSRVKGDRTLYQNLSDIQHALTTYHHLTNRAIRNDLRDALKAFPKLANVRLVALDRPQYLGGWLTAEEKQYVEDKFKPGTSFWRMTNGIFTAQHFYDSSDWDPACSVFKVLNGIGVHVQQLRISEWIGSRPERFCYFLPESLLTLNVTVGWSIHGHLHGGGGRKGEWAKLFFRALGRMLNLQNLALGKVSRSVGTRWADQLFDTLKRATKLHRVDLKGDWISSTNILCGFVEHHADTLRCLSLNGCSMEGRWLATLHSLAETLGNDFEYFRLLNPQCNPDGLWTRTPEELNSYHRFQWPQFTCITDFGPNFQLLPDPNETELEEGSDQERA